MVIIGMDMVPRIIDAWGYEGEFGSSYPKKEAYSCTTKLLKHGNY